MASSKLFLTHILIFHNFIYAQDKDYYNVVNVLPKQEYTLNSTTRINGTSEVIVPVTLPKNTSSWYYSFQTYKVEDPKNSSNLFVEITKLVGGGMYSGLAQSLSKPTGVIACNLQVYINGQPSIGSRKMLTAGVVEVNSPEDNGGQLKIMISNPDYISAVKFSIELVAITFDKNRYNNDKLKRSLNDLSNSITEITEISKKKKEERIARDYQEFNNHMKLVKLKFEKDEFDQAIALLNDFLNKRNYFDFYAYFQLGNAYRNKGNYNEAIKQYNKSLKSAPNDPEFKSPAYGGLGLTYLLMGDLANANKAFIQFLNNCLGEKCENIKTNLIEIIEKFRAKGIEMKGAEDILIMLKN